MDMIRTQNKRAVKTFLGIFFLMALVSLIGCSQESSVEREEEMLSSAEGGITQEIHAEADPNLFDKYWVRLDTESQDYIRQSWEKLPKERRPDWRIYRNNVLQEWRIILRQRREESDNEGDIVDSDMPFVVEEIVEALYFGDEVLDGEPQDGGKKWGPYDDRTKENGEVRSDTGAAVPLVTDPDTSGGDDIDKSEWSIGGEPHNPPPLDKEVARDLY